MHATKPIVLNETQRLSVAVLPAAIITNVIILIMLSLITTDFPEINEGSIRIDAVVMAPPPPLEVLEDEIPAKPLDPLETPAWEPTEATLVMENTTTAFPATATDFTPVKDNIEFTGGGGIVAYLKVEPVYPSRQLSRGIEGFVDLAFDITPAGGTTNIRVIASEPEGAFDKAAIDALKKWKYKVPTDADIATGQRDMMTRISFAIDA
jgi:protein TonB